MVHYSVHYDFSPETSSLPGNEALNGSGIYLLTAGSQAHNTSLLLNGGDTIASRPELTNLFSTPIADFDLNARGYDLPGVDTTLGTNDLGAHEQRDIVFYGGFGNKPTN